MKRHIVSPLAAAILSLIGPFVAAISAAQIPDGKLAEVRQLLAAEDAQAALDKLVASLGSDDARGRLTAALAIAAIADRVSADADDEGPDFAPAAAALLPLLTADDDGLVRAVATALGTIGPVGDDDAVDDAVDALSRAAARVKDAATRAACLVALADYGPAAQSAVPAIVKFLRAKTALVRETAAATLAAIGPESRVATSELARLLGDEQPLVRAAAAAALSSIGPDARDATAALAAALADSNPMVRGGAARALASIGPDAGAATGMLVKALGGEKDRDVVLGIIDAFGEIGPAAIEATPTLVASLSSDDAETREAIVSALGELGTGAAPTAASAVENMLGDADPFVRVAAAGGLVGMGRAAGRERNVLLTALRSDDEELQAAAAEVVGDWGKAAAGFSAALAKIASNAKDPQARAAAVTALGDIAAADQAETLGKALDDDDADVRHAAAYAIADLPEIVAGLEAAIVAAADDDDVRVRMEIAPTLARLGTPAAKKALDALANDEDGNVADVAKQVAGKTSVKAK